MKASESSIVEFLAGNKKVFAIPVYQRNYSWERSHCKRLFDDIIAVGRNNPVGGHFIGSIVYLYDGTPSVAGLQEWTIIDGQQRLTTLTLLYSALYRYALNNGLPVADEIYETYLTNKFAPETERLKLKPTENNKEALRRVFEDQIDDFPEYSKIIENYRFFRDKINEDDFEIIQKGLSRLVYVDISLKCGEDSPQRIFESLNSTGLDLSQADLIRNYVLMGLSREEQEKIYSTYWEVIEKNAKDAQLNESRVSDFIRDYLTLKNSVIPKKGSVYETFKNQYPTATFEELKSVLSEMLSLSKTYGKLLNPPMESDVTISKHLEYIKQLTVNVSYPFLMQVYVDYIESKIDKNVFVSVLELVQSYAFRRFIVGLPTNALNKVFMSLYDKIDQANYLYSVQKALLRMTGSTKFPKNREIESELVKKDVYNTASKNRNYLFERLENHNNKEPVRISGNPDITLEHIFPQNPEDAWKNHLSEEEYRNIKENYLHTIGNLTFSGNNGSLGNKSFLEKRDMNFEGKEQGYRFSRLWLNRDLKEKKQWNILEIEARVKRLTERFLAVWEIPEIDIDETSESVEVSIFEAEDPTHKRLEYAILFNEKIDARNFADLYTQVINRFLDDHAEAFFNSAFAKNKMVKLTRTPKGNLQYSKVNEEYYVFTNSNSQEKLKLLKELLNEFDCDENDLIIKYA